MSEPNLVTDIKQEPEKSSSTSKRDLIEGREHSEGELANWFHTGTWPVLLAKIPGKGDPPLNVTRGHGDRPGYGMMSRASVEENTLVLSAPPYVFVPYETKKKTVCAYCYRSRKDETVTSTAKDGAILGSKWHECAGGCKQIWYCCDDCEEKDKIYHFPYECQGLQQMDTAWIKEYYQYCDDLITDVRLLVRSLHRRRIEVDLNEMEENRTENGVYLMDEQIPLADTLPMTFDQVYALLIANKSAYAPDVLDSLRGVVQLANWLMPDEAQIEEEVLLDIYCKHRVNMFGIWGEAGECLGYGIYPQASYFNHSCWPNTTFFRNETQHLPYLDFSTIYKIENEAEVSISYIDISTDLATRRHTLSDKYFFFCTCDRCVYQHENPTLPDPYFEDQNENKSESGSVTPEATTEAQK